MSNNSVLTLSNEFACVKVAPELGGAILSYEAKVEGQLYAIFKPSEAANTVHETSCFPLVPFSNRVRNGQFKWQEQNICLKLNHLPEKHAIHGHGWQNIWQVINKSSNSVELQFHYLPDDWPFEYLATQKIMLDGNKLTVSLEVTNLSTQVMPIGLGLHPYFNRTDECFLQANVNKMWATDDEVMPTRLVDAPEGISTAQGMKISENALDNAFTDFDHTANIFWPEWQIQAALNVSNNCDFLVVYSPKDESYFCVEPVTHCTDALNLHQQSQEYTGQQQLLPNTTSRVEMSITPQTLNS